MQVVASPEAVELIRRSGGLLFVWATTHRSFRLSLTLLEASTDPPARALDFARVEAEGFLLFLHPAIRRLPGKLHVELRGGRRPHVEVFWDGLAYVV